MNAGLILAAGESRRMGSPKALLEYQGETFLDRLVRLFSAVCSPVIVVTGAHAAEIQARAGQPCAFVWNGDYRSGQTSSLQAGLRAVPAEAEGVLFTLVDHPAVSAESIAALTPLPDSRGSMMNGRGPLLRVPRYQGRRGHPVWLSAALIPEFLALPATAAARDVVRAHAEQTAFLDLDDPGIVADIDDPAAYRSLIEVQA
ncbi:MAG TPA: nucleotidyltransferase family protein [Bryobacteraceae bacterium]|nr:nucleotidyltransferase family protein [Bryobacteraceae bacterium]